MLRRQKGVEGGGMFNRLLPYKGGVEHFDIKMEMEGRTAGFLFAIP
jgi:hypothetical protein